MAEFADRAFASLLEAGPVAMVCVDGEGLVRLMNAAAVQLFGYRKEELTGQPVEVLVPEPLRPVHFCHRASYLADPRPVRLGANRDLTARRKDGSTFLAEISLSAIDTGDSTLVVAAVRDLGEQRRAEAASAWLAAIVQASNDPVIGTTTDRVITAWNPAAERLYGWTAAEMIGRPVSRIIPPEELDREQAIIARVAQGVRVGSYQTRRLHRDGSVVDVSLTMYPLTDTTGKVTGMSGITRDLTGQAPIDTRFIGLLEAAPDAMVCVADDGLITLVNAQAERLFGYARDELTGRPVEILVPEQSRDRHPGHREHYLAEPRPRPMASGLDPVGRRKDGSTFPAEISLSAIHTSDGILITAAVRDISERLAIQAERERLSAQAERDRLERGIEESRRMESLGQLAGGVAHDFNNLLGVITSYTAMVGEDVAGHLPAGQRQQVAAQLGYVQEAAMSAAELTRQLLTFARQDVVKPRVLQVNEVVTSVKQLLLRTLGEHIELITELDPGVQPVLADPGQIEQVLVNLAVNARDAMRTGGHLTVRTSNLEVGQQARSRPSDPRPGQYVTLKVADTGTGIPREIVDRVFEPFFTTKPEGQGTGLGLATVYGIVTQAGGYLKIYTEAGIGTTVTALLPVSGQAAAAGTAPAHELARPQLGSGQTVLLVEDETALREVTRRMLSRSGYQVLTAANGPQALSALGQHPAPVHVLLTDVIMPQMPGKQLAAKVRADHPEVAVLFMSGYTEALLIAQGVLEPGDRLVEKPFDQAGLLGKVSEVLGTAGQPEHAAQQPEAAARAHRPEPGPPAHHPHPSPPQPESQQGPRNIRPR